MIATNNLASCEVGREEEMAASAIIIGMPGPLRDGLHALVESMPQVDSVQVASDVSALLTQGPDLGPVLVLLDAGEPGERVWRTVRRAKARWPQARTVVLVNTVKQQQEAEDAGADTVLLQGLPAGRLIAAIVRLLPQRVM